MDRQVLSELLKKLVSLSYDTGYCHGRIALWREHGMSEDDWHSWDQEHKRIKKNRDALRDHILNMISPE